MPSKLNQMATRELATLFQKVSSAVVVDFTGVGSEETYQLRKTLRQQKVTLRVVKGSLAKVALKQAGTRFDDGSFAGSVGLAFSDDPVAVVKALQAHRKNKRDTKLKVKGGFLDKNPLKPAEIADLANMPGRQQMLGMVAGAFAAPIAAFVGVHASIIRKFVSTVDAVREQAEKKAG
jgi:large subunit ribosomal protein L10